MLNLPGGISFSLPSLAALDTQVLQAIFTAIVIFITAVLLGFSRHYLISSSLKGVWAGFVVGIISVVILEGVVFFGVKTYVFGEKAASLPDNIRLIVDNSRENITQVLGIKTERDRPTAQTVVSDYQVLSSLDAELVQNSICKQEK